MGVNVVFDLLDNSDDIEPVPAENRDLMLLSSRSKDTHGEPST